MQLSTKSIGIFVAAVLAASLLGDHFRSRDAVLPGVKDFVAASPEVVAQAGAVEDVRVQRLVNVAGAPGKQAPHRQYQLSVIGSQGAAKVTVRATRAAGAEGWGYELVTVHRQQ